MAPGGLLRASPGQRLRRLGQEFLPYRSGTQMGACGHRCGVDAQSQAANSRPARRAIAIVTALDNYRGGRRGFLPRGLCNTCPTAVRVLDRLCGWAGVTQALTLARQWDIQCGLRISLDVIEQISQCGIRQIFVTADYAIRQHGVQQRHF